MKERRSSGVRERPILFSAPMVRAILDDRKTQTRRVVKPQPDATNGLYIQPMHGRSPDGVAFGDPRMWRVVGEDYPDSEKDDVCCPYVTGDRLWVRETFCIGYEHAPGQFTAIPFSGCEAHRRAFYRATDPDAADGPQRPWRPSIHMPRWASRITLEITDVCVERLQEITPTDAHAEGMQYDAVERVWHIEGQHGPANSARDAFACLFESINGKGTWKKNPWVWAVTFRRVQP
jgi:hypothetical protein